MSSVFAEQMPIRMQGLAIWNGKPVPWFVAWVDGVPDFRVMDARKLPIAVQESRCWICGQKLGKYKTFLLGPMCVINRTISEPPSHRDCARFSAVVCPFLSQPGKSRREQNLPDGYTEAPGVGLRRNPRVVALWTTFSFKPFRAFAGNRGILFTVGEPEFVEWIAEGRTATRAEVMASIDYGLPLLQEEATREGPAAERELERYVQRAQKHLPIVDPA